MTNVSPSPDTGPKKSGHMLDPHFNKYHPIPNAIHVNFTP